MNKDILKVLVSEQQLDALTTRLASEIDRDFGGKCEHLVLLGILKGSLPFMADLMKKLKTNPEIELMKVSSYGSSTKSSGSVKIVLDWQRKNIEECDILVIEDIIDSGRTLSYLCGYLKQKGAKACIPVLCSINPPAGKSTLRPITAARSSRTNLWSATGSITTKNTARSPI